MKYTIQNKSRNPKNKISEIGDGLDVGIVPADAFINGATMTEQDVLQAIDNVIIKVHDTGDIEFADDVIDSLLSVQHTTGRSLAKLFWSMEAFWKKSGRDEETGDTFADYMVTRHNIKQVQLDRYIRVWEFTENNELPKAIWKRPMKDQIPIAAMLEQGYEPSKEQWKELERAKDNNEVLGIIRKIKKKPAKKGSLQIELERDGSIQAWANGTKVFVGFLNIKEQDKNETLNKAIERIINNSGIKRK